jgi:hypothetical protein
MGEVATIKPAKFGAAFPLGKPFHAPDTFNGPVRGNWWWRSKTEFFGPFASEEAAAENILDQPIEPYQDVTHYWWWAEPSGHGHGPYRTLRDADIAIAAFVNGAQYA